jgi:hypothetical protein
MATRAHIVIADDVLDEVDRVAGKRRRSEYIETAIREKLARERQSAALRATRGALDPRDYPAWSPPEAVSEWVRASRHADEERLTRMWREPREEN